jgi:hypothetical protein
MTTFYPSVRRRRRFFLYDRHEFPKVNLYQSSPFRIGALLILYRHTQDRLTLQSLGYCGIDEALKGIVGRTFE